MKELTRKQCSYIAGGDPGMSLAGVGGGGEGGGGFYGGGGSAWSPGEGWNGVGVAGGPMAVVSVPGPMAEMPSADHLRFDGQLSGMAGAAAGAAAGAFLTGIAEGAALGIVAVSAVPVIALAVTFGVGYGVYRLLQADHAAHESK